MNEQNTLFVNASRRKFRFQSAKGLLTTEDLWDLSLAALDKIAVDLDDKIQKAGRKSFIGRSTADTESTQQLDVVKFVIETKQAENELAKIKETKRAQKQFLESLLEKKKIMQLEGLSVEDIEKQLAAIPD